MKIDQSKKPWTEQNQIPDEPVDQQANNKKRVTMQQIKKWIGRWLTSDIETHVMRCKFWNNTRGN
jgi:hypothetical protein